MSHISILDRSLDDLRGVLKFCGVNFNVQLIQNALFSVSLQLRCGTVHQLVLDIGSLVVRRSMLNVLASVLHPVLYQALSSRLNHRSISNGVDFETPRIVALSDTSSEVDTDSSEMTAVEEPRSSRVIPLPYIGQRERGPQKRRRRTVASLLGDIEYFVCKHCFKSFSRRSNMTRHIERTHCGRVVFQCTQCSAVYKHAFHFADHLRAHEDEPQFFCDACEKQFASRNQLRSHRRRNCKDPVALKRPAGCRKSRQYAPQRKGPYADVAASTGRLHIPYDFPVTL